MTFNGYLELHGCELIIIGALFIGVTLGMCCGLSLGKDRRYYARRDAKGRFIKRSSPLEGFMHKQTLEQGAAE